MSRSIDPQAVALLFEVKKNQLKMVRRRGYDISKETHILKTRLQNFLDAYIPFAEQQGKTFRAVLTSVYTHKDNGKRLVVYYADAIPGKQLGKNEITDAISEMDKQKSKDAIIITPRGLSPVARKSIEALISYNIQIFLEEEMAYDPTEHRLVPEHIPLTEEEGRKVLEKNDLNIDQLPAIKVNDIMCKYYGMRQGQIMKIIRVNMYDSMVQNSVVYRAVKE